MKILFSATIVYCISLLLPSDVSGHAVYFTYPSYCPTRGLSIGQTVMGANAVADTTGKTMIVTRGGTNLASGSFYVAGETLQVMVSGFSKVNFEVVLQAQGGSAAFQNGGVTCGSWSRAAASIVTGGTTTYVGIDSTTGTASLLLPPAGSGDVTVFAGYSYGYGAVSIVTSFILKDPVAKGPSPSPSRSPTAPTKIPSILPTSNPSVAPVILPSSIPTARPTGPTVPPSSQLLRPSAVPAILPSPSPFSQPIPVTPGVPSLVPTTSQPTASPTVSITSDLWSSQGGNIKNSRNVVGSLINSKTFSLSAPTHAFMVGFSVSATPAIFGNLVIFPSYNGYLYAFNKTSKAMVWSVNIKTAYYPTSSLSKVVCRTTPAKYGSSFLVGLLGPADVIKVDIATGTLQGKVTLSSHIAAMVTMTGTVYNGKFYIGVSSNEESLAVDPSYTCCSFGGTFHAVDMKTMTLAWTWWAIPFNYVGPRDFAGAAIWGSSPSIDTDAGTVYFATGNNYIISPELSNCFNATAEADWETKCNEVYAPDNYVESVVALNINSGVKVWARRLTAYDAWTVACFYSGSPNCPKNPGEDSDFGMAPVLSTVAGQKALFIGQKNGIAHRLNPYDGSTVWATQTCPGGTLGGMSWGISVDDSRTYVSCINYLHLPWTLKNGTVVYGGGWAALDKSSGKVLWTTANPANFDPSGGVFSQTSNGRAYTSWGSGPSTSVGDIVLVGSSDSVYKPQLGGGVPTYGNGGFVYSLNKTSGAILSSYETKAGVYGGFSVDSRCAFIGSGYSFLSAGKGVYGWCLGAKPV